MGYTAPVKSIAIVCALEFERRKLARGRAERVRVVLAGQGAQRAASCVRTLADQGVRVAILAGVAGGLRLTPMCPRVSRVVDRHGSSWTPTLGAESAGGITLLGVDEPVIDPGQKAALGVAHDADVVDCESHGFAEAASRAGLDWTIVRGVSDGPRDRLDPRIVAWIDESGRVRRARLVTDVLRCPLLVGRVSRLARCAGRAMHAVSARVDEIIRATEADADG